jgi:hypothetical protein
MPEAQGRHGKVSVGAVVLQVQGKSRLFGGASARWGTTALTTNLRPRAASLHEARSAALQREEFAFRLVLFARERPPECCWLGRMFRIKNGLFSAV